MYRQFDSSSDKPKSAARLLAEAAFAPPSASRYAADSPAPVVKVVNRRFTLQRYDRLASNDAPVNVQQAQQTPVAAKTARVFLLPAQAADAGSSGEPELMVAGPAVIADAMPSAIRVAIRVAIPAASLAEMPSVPQQSVSPAAALTALFAGPADMQAEPQRRNSKLWRKSRRSNPHGPVRVIYSAPPAIFAAAQTDDGAQAASQPQELESILFLQQQIAGVDALLADIQFAQNFSLDVNLDSGVAELKSLLAELDRLSVQFPAVD